MLHSGKLNLERQRKSGGCLGPRVRRGIDFHCVGEAFQNKGAVLYVMMVITQLDMFVSAGRATENGDFSMYIMPQLFKRFIYLFERQS